MKIDRYPGEDSIQKNEQCIIICNKECNISYNSAPLR
jgi:hypothetical protein